MKNNKAPGWVLFTLGVAYPAGVIGFEFFTQLCAEAFFDPMPSFWHGVMVCIVPLSNFLLWQQLRQGRFRRSDPLTFLAALSIGVAAMYTLIFLPLTPLAAIAVVYFGIGLLPLAPLISLVVAIILYRRYCAALAAQNRGAMPVWRGVGAALLILVVLDIPVAATHLGIRWAAGLSAEESLRGVRLLRLLGDEDVLLRRSYDRTGRASGPLSFAMALTSHSGLFPFTSAALIPVAKVREIYYSVTGEPFNLRPPPYSGGRWQRANEFQFDRDQGGTEIGGLLKGLHLTSSRIDGSLNSDQGVAYLEWTLEFSNASARQREVRLQLALPPGGVVSRATLWIDGEEREAAFAGRAQVKRAYESVVRRLRDPLLVTTRGIDRLQAQAFPLAPDGGTIKFRLGITAPLEMLGPEQVQLILPAIVDRNFVIGDQLDHAIWVESRGPLQTSLPRVELQKVDASLYRLNASLDDSALSRSANTITATRDAASARWRAQFDGQQPVVQDVVEQITAAAGALLIVVDGSARTAAAVDHIAQALAHIPAGARVGLIVAAEDEVRIPIGEWTPSRQQQVLQALASTDFVGGQDNAPALAEAFRQLETFDNGELLWIHFPQPVEFSYSAAAFEQTLSRLSRLPRTTLYSLAPGPNKLLTQGNWELWSRTLPHTGKIAGDLADYFETTLTPGQRYEYYRYATAQVDGLPEGSNHIARLWARDQIHDLLKHNGKDNLRSAIDIAATHQLVTVVSGAVVLENARQYDDNDLRPMDSNSVPTIPEPEQWLLALIVIVMMLWLTRQNLQQRAALTLSSRKM